MKNLIPILLAVVVLSSGCDPDGYSCNSEGCYEDNDNPQYQTLEDCNNLCNESLLIGQWRTFDHPPFGSSSNQDWTQFDLTFYDNNTYSMYKFRWPGGMIGMEFEGYGGTWYVEHGNHLVLLGDLSEHDEFQLTQDGQSLFCFTANWFKH